MTDRQTGLSEGRHSEMALPHFPYVNQYRDRHGKVRRYFRRPGQKHVALPGLPGSDEFMAAYREALAGERKRPIGAARHAPDSLAAWVSLYLGSTTFAALAPETQRTRRNILDRFRQEHGDKRARLLKKQHIESMVAAKANTPSAQRNFLNTLRGFLAWCAIEGLREDNPANDVTRPPIRGTEGFKTWPQEYITTYRARFPLGSKERLAFELYVSTGAARADVARMGRQHVRDGIISFRRKKTGVLVEIPMLRELQAAIDAMPAPKGKQPQLTFLVTEYGKPFTDAGLGMWFRERCNMAGIPVGYAAHGIRKYTATEHANHGATTHELMAWFGWLTVREAERYTKAVARRKLAVGMVAKLIPRAPNHAEENENSTSCD